MIIISLQYNLKEIFRDCSKHIYKSYWYFKDIIENIFQSCLLDSIWISFQVAFCHVGTIKRR